MLSVRSRISPLRLFSVLSFLSIGALSVVLGFAVSWSVTQSMLDRELDTTATFIQSQVREHDLHSLFAGPPGALGYADGKSLIAPLLSIHEVVRIKVYDRKGTILWADEPRLIGRNFSDNHELQEALQGKIEVELKQTRKTENLYEWDRYSTLAEIYVPIHRDDGGAVIGVVEVYKNPVVLFDHIRKARILIWVICIAGGAAFYSAVYWLFRRSHLLQRQLEEVSRHKSEFVSNMSHELRTPLNAIIGFSEILQTQAIGPLTPKQLRYVGHIRTSGGHLLQLVNDLLDLSKVEAGKLEVHPGRVPVGQAIEAAMTALREQAAKKNLTLGCPSVDESLMVLADPVRFNQILLNLLSNAVKFTPEGGRLAVSARRNDSRMVEISVADTGIGLKPEDQSRIFKEFEQVDTPLGRQQRGAGLGLPVTKRLVELQGGSIEVSSSGEGQGSTFTVRLPLVDPVGVTT